MSDLDGRTALVTGGSGGLGRAVALELARRGANVAVNYNSSADAASEVVKSIEAVGSRAYAFHADVTDYDQADNLVKQTIEAFDGLDILVNNAGTTRDMVMMMMPESDWDVVIGTNLKSAYNCTKHAVKHMIRKRYGRVVNMTSVAGIAGNAGQTNYSASKAGLIGLTKALAREVASRNITVNAVAPGFIPTALTEIMPEELKTASLNSIPLKRWGTPEEVAFAVAFLASDQAAYITGHVLSVDGGMVMG